LRAALGRWFAGLVGSDAGSPWRNRVVVFEDRGATGVPVDTLVEGLPSGPVHAGGGLRFGPDGLLYLGLGEGGNPPLAQERTSQRGKILRFDDAGAPAAGNPDPASPLFALGLRNVQGIAWDPVSGAMLAVDHGPSGLEREGYRAAQDELNRVVAGANYGWPVVSGAWEGEGFTGPIAEWTPAIAPSAITFVDRPGSPWHGDAIVAGLMGNALYRVVFERADASGELVGVACQEPLFSRTLGRVRAVRVGPDGFVYLSTSNRDQRGVPRPGDDLLLRFSLPTLAP
jgi:glucose/arabinose dehydrogenase